MANDTANTIGSVEHTFTIVESIAASGPTTLSELAEYVDMPKSTVHVHLRTLVDRNVLTRRGDKYDLGLKFLEMGGIARRRRDVYRTARDEVDGLADETGEASHLGVEENGKRSILYKSEAEESVYDDAPTGERTHMHWTALGKALLAHLPESRVERIVDRWGLPAGTESTIVDRGRLFDELERIRSRGFAIEDEERRIGVLAVAVPVMDVDAEDVVAAVSVSGPKCRLTAADGDEIRPEIRNAVRSRANVIELQYNHY